MQWILLNITPDVCTDGLMSVMSLSNLTRCSTYLDLPEPLDPKDYASSKIEAMKQFYPDTEEAILDNAPAPRGKLFK